MGYRQDPPKELVDKVLAARGLKVADVVVGGKAETKEKAAL